MQYLVFTYNIMYCIEGIKSVELTIEDWNSFEFRQSFRTL